MFVNVNGSHLMTLLTKEPELIEINDLAISRRHSMILGSTIRVVELGDAKMKANLPFFVTDGNHALILGARFQMACTCYQVHDALGYTCFHSQAVPIFCEHGLPVF